MGKERIFEEILEFTKEKLENKNGNRKPIKVIKMKPEWMKLQKEAEEAKRQAKVLANKHDSITDEKWAKIRRELNYPAYDLEISKDGKELMLFETK